MTDSKDRLALRALLDEAKSLHEYYNDKRNQDGYECAAEDESFELARNALAQPDPVPALVEALRLMVDAYGKYASTPKENRCYPTTYEVNSYQRQAMDAARAALTGEQS